MRGFAWGILVAAALVGGLYMTRQHPEILGSPPKTPDGQPRQEAEPASRGADADNAALAIAPGVPEGVADDVALGDTVAAPDPEPRSRSWWSEHPALGSVPSDGVTGSLAGQDFRAASVVIDTQSGGTAKIRISDQGVAPSDAPPSDSSGAVLALDRDIVDGLSFSRQLGPSVGPLMATYHRLDDDGQPVTVTCPWSCAIEITSGERLPYDPEGNLIQLGGSLSGRISISFDDQERSWIAGTFSAPVRYFGAP